MKKNIIIALMLSVVFSSITVIANENPVLISINGVAVEFPDAQPFVDENNRTQVPIGALAEFLGMEITWDEGTQTANLFMEKYRPLVGDYVKITIGKNKVERGTYDLNTYYDVFYPEQAFYPDANIEMDTTAVLKDNRTFVPIHYVAQWLDFVVEWDETSNSVNLRSIQREIINNTSLTLNADKFVSAYELHRNLAPSYTLYDESFFEDSFLVIVSWTNGIPQSHLEVASIIERENSVEIGISFPPSRPEDENRVWPAVVTTFSSEIVIDRSLINKDISLEFIPREDTEQQAVGKLDGDLFNKLDTLGSKDRIHVSVWLQNQEDEDIAEIKRSFAEKLNSKNININFEPALTPRRHRHITVTFDSALALTPRLYLSVTKEELMTIQEFPEVESINTTKTYKVPMTITYD